MAIVQLAPLPKGTWGGASGINDNGVIVGSTLVGGFNRPAAWSPDGTVTALDVLPDMRSGFAVAINNNGTIAGFTSASDGTNTATLWASDGTVSALPGGPNCVAHAINSSGVVVGRCGSVPVRWSPDGTVTALAMADGDQAGEALGINTSGVIIGWLSNRFSSPRPVRWNPDGTIADLGGAAGEARGINDSGQIAGTLVVPSPDGVVNQAVRWNPDGATTPLPGARKKYSVANAISPDGTVAGSALDATSRFVPATWSPSGSFTVLPSFTSGNGTSGQATAINKHNVIAGQSLTLPARWSAPA